MSRRRHIAWLMVAILASGSAMFCYLTWRNDTDPPAVLTADCELQGYYPAGAASLSPDEAKAVSVAKSELQEDPAEPLDARYRVTQTETGYEVHVFFVTAYDAQGCPIFIPGGHCTVLIAKDWSILKIMPGA